MRRGGTVEDAVTDVLAGSPGDPGDFERLTRVRADVDAFLASLRTAGLAA
jgi:hypothetical protein